jgi:anti-sigma B factor antagonist
MAMTMAGEGELLAPEWQAQSSAPAGAGPAWPPPGPPVTVIPLPESIDTVNDLDVQDMLSAAVDGGAAVLVADGSRTTFCGCSGVTALLLAHHRAAAAGAQLRLVAAAPLVRRILAVTGADQELDIYPDRAAALGGRQGRPAFPAGSTQAGRPIIPVPAP